MQQFSLGHGKICLQSVAVLLWLEVLCGWRVSCG